MENIISAIDATPINILKKELIDNVDQMYLHAIKE